MKKSEKIFTTALFTAFLCGSVGASAFGHAFAYSGDNDDNGHSLDEAKGYFSAVERFTLQGDYPVTVSALEKIIDDSPMAPSQKNDLKKIFEQKNDGKYEGNDPISHHDLEKFFDLAQAFIELGGYGLENIKFSPALEAAQVDIDRHHVPPEYKQYSEAWIVLVTAYHKSDITENPLLQQMFWNSGNNIKTSESYAGYYGSDAATAKQKLGNIVDSLKANGIHVGDDNFAEEFVKRADSHVNMDFGYPDIEQRIHANADLRYALYATNAFDNAPSFKQQKSYDRAVDALLVNVVEKLHAPSIAKAIDDKNFMPALIEVIKERHDIEASDALKKSLFQSAYPFKIDTTPYSTTHPEGAHDEHSPAYHYHAHGTHIDKNGYVYHGSYDHQDDWPTYKQKFNDAVKKQTEPVKPPPKSKYPKPEGKNGGYTEQQIRDMFSGQKKN